jgi:hypothetical protein
MRTGVHTGKFTMKRWQRIATVVSLALLGLLSKSGSALAQSEGNTPSILSGIIVPILVFIDRLFDFWVDSVTGNTLTSAGEELVRYIATIVQNLALFFAEFSTLLSSNVSS